MATRSVQESSLTSLADAIRAKGGTSDTLAFPSGFVEAIEAIQTGDRKPVVWSALCNGVFYFRRRYNLHIHYMYSP